MLPITEEDIKPAERSKTTEHEYGIQQYSEMRKEYKKLIKEKKASHIEEEAKKQAEKSQKNSFSLLIRIVGHVHRNGNVGETFLTATTKTRLRKHIPACKQEIFSSQTSSPTRKFEKL